MEPLATDALRCCVQEKESGDALDVEAEDDWRAKGEQATSSFLSCVFGKGVEDFSELSALVYKHFTSLSVQGMRDCLASYRQEQLLRIKAEIAATYSAAHATAPGDPADAAGGGGGDDDRGDVLV